MKSAHTQTRRAAPYNPGGEFAHVHRRNYVTCLLLTGWLTH